MGRRLIAPEIKEELGRIHLLHWGHFFFFLLATLTEFLEGGAGFFLILKVFLILIYYSFFAKMKHNLHYSFWTFAILLGFYFFIKIFQSPFTDGPSLFYLVAFTLLMIEIFMLYSPVYYPIVSWWEYDFRYRDDLKIKITFDQKDIEGRLTDFRKKAACIAAFENIPLGATLHVDILKENMEKLSCIVLSRRQYSLGRPYQYGVRFPLERSEERQRFGKFSKFWNKRKKNRMKKIFTHHPPS